jgi:hypothetical protein
VEAVKQARDWTLGMAAFDRVLAALNQAPAAPAGAGPVAGPDALGEQRRAAAAGDSGAAGPAAELPRKRRRAAPAGGAAEGKRRRAGAAADACTSGAPAEPRSKRRKRAGAQGDGARAAPEGAAAAADGAAQSAASPAGAEAGGGAAAAAGEGRAGGSHLARFTLRRRCKDARSYSGADLAAILGAAPEPGERTDDRALPTDGPQAACAPGASAHGRDRSVGRRRARRAGRPTAAPLPRATAAARSRSASGGRAGAGGAPGEEVEVLALARAPDPEDAWWRRCFVRAGRLGSQAQAAAAAAAGLQPGRPKVRPARRFFLAAMQGLQELLPGPLSGSHVKLLVPGSSITLCARQIKVAGFSEDDQANLYMAAHDASGKGRQGLGIASRPKKVAGARWQVRAAWPPCGSAPRCARVG